MSGDPSEPQRSSPPQVEVQAATLVVRTHSGLMKRMLAAQKRERDQLVQELARMRGVMPLLMKRRNGGRWHTHERDALLQHLRAAAHISPYLVVMVLPGSFLLLPVLAWWLDRRRQVRADRLTGA